MALQNGNQEPDFKSFSSESKEGLIKNTCSHYCAVSALDVQATVDFYVKSFGGEIVGGWNTLKFPGDHILDLPTKLVRVGGGIFEIVQSDAKDVLQVPQKIGLNHLCITTDDCERDYQSAIDNGGSACLMVKGEIEWDGKPTMVELDNAERSSLKIAFITGPNGEMIELLEYCLVASIQK